MARAKKETVLTTEERLQQALVQDWEQLYKVPENWCWTRIGTISEVVTGGTPSKKISEYYSGNFPFFKPADLDAGRHVFEASEYLSEAGKDVSRVIPAESTAVCCIGSIGKCGFLDTEGTTNQQINSAIPRLNALFLYYYCNTDVFVNQLWSMASATTISIVNKSKMESCMIPVAPLVEQLRIVDRIESLFAKLDEAKEKAQEVVDSFEIRKAAILHKAFTGELTAQWREEHGVELESWENVELQDICIINPKKVDTKDLSDNLEVSFFPMPALSEILGAITAPETRKLKEVRSGFTNFSEGDVVFAKITPCMENGKSAVIDNLVNGLGFGTTEFYVLRCGERLFNHYLHHIVRNRTFRDEAKAVMTGAVGQQRVPKSFLEEYIIALPSVIEQKEIVSILDRIFEKELQVKEISETTLEQIDQIKKSILARAFRGELGTNDPNDESALELLKNILSNESDKKPETPRKKTVLIPERILQELSSELEKEIIRMYFKKDVKSLPIADIMIVSTKKFETLESLRKLEQKGLIKKQSNGNYDLMR